MNIIFIGFMGSGKSSIGEALAKKLKHNLLETDALVLAQSGRNSIKEIFSRDGELRFREMEIAIAKKLGEEKNAVISTGGGMIINKICVDYLKQSGIVIYLCTSFEEITKRLEGDKTRPLFKDRLDAKKLFQFRIKLYREYADITVKTNTLSVDEIINIILKKI